MAKQCPKCDGVGIVEKSDNELLREGEEQTYSVPTKQCPYCHGTGEVEDEV